MLHDFGASVEDAALAIIAIANENMANSIRVLTVERGIDPRSFALVAFGGAWSAARDRSGPDPRHSAGDRATGPRCGLGPWSAAHDSAGRHPAPYVRRGENVSIEELNGVLADLTRNARADLAAEGYAEAPDIRATISMRYLGRSS